MTDSHMTDAAASAAHESMARLSRLMTILIGTKRTAELRRHLQPDRSSRKSSSTVPRRSRWLQPSKASAGYAEAVRR